MQNDHIIFHVNESLLLVTKSFVGNLNHLPIESQTKIYISQRQHD